MLLGRYRFFCRFQEDALLPTYKGSTFRGAFGNALKRVVCAVREKDCGRCLLAQRCLYARVFEPAPRPDGLRLATPPHPYVIEPPLDPGTRYTSGDSFDFNLLLFGEFNDYLPYFVYAFEAMGEQGLGARRGHGMGRYALKCVTSGARQLYNDQTRQLEKPRPDMLRLAPPTDASGTLGVKLVTPLRLKHDNQLQAELPFHLMTRAALRRVSTLFACFGEGEPPLDYRGLVARAQDIEVVCSRLRWCDWQRYSNRQEQAMLMDGMSGEITYRGALGEYLPLLEIARAVHLGKQSAFGLGQIDYSFQPDLPA
ncbi:CRISPR system precrRNA processing endoribonuclease RAMP protein Cas6 [Geoalkalibacter sp.]|uniref:CRISPR system precrRNA processing endoribonuclease RAMP protein Cas6 n=1 Tax=Geoalkalibacter sp. TaxID=3041440 RepID=UPI00272ECE57|nr:CRISPR system precrRNA processing endoribonuclease RAMP protein Cas6 [Geoalkalibacter sp.]